MQQYEEVLKSLDILMEDLSPQQLEGIKRLSNDVTDPNNMTVDEAMKIVKELNLDIEKLQKNARKFRAELTKQNKKPKIAVNEKCPCGSNKKYKKCCIWKEHNN